MPRPLAKTRFFQLLRAAVVFRSGASRKYHKPEAGAAAFTCTAIIIPRRSDALSPHCDTAEAGVTEGAKSVHGVEYQSMMRDICARRALEHSDTAYVVTHII